jgi:hypothetical protein
MLESMTVQLGPLAQPLTAPLPLLGPAEATPAPRDVRVPASKDLALGLGGDGPIDVSDLWAADSQPSGSQATGSQAASASQSASQSVAQSVASRRTGGARGGPARGEAPGGACACFECAGCAAQGRAIRGCTPCSGRCGVPSVGSHTAACVSVSALALAGLDEGEVRGYAAAYAQAMHGAEAGQGPPAAGWAEDPGGGGGGGWGGAMRTPSSRAARPRRSAATRRSQQARGPPPPSYPPPSPHLHHGLHPHAAHGPARGHAQPQPSGAGRAGSAPRRRPDPQPGGGAAAPPRPSSGRRAVVPVALQGPGGGGGGWALAQGQGGSRSRPGSPRRCVGRGRAWVADTLPCSTRAYASFLGHDSPFPPSPPTPR